MARPPRVVAVEHVGGHQLRLTFSDGLVRELDFTDALRTNVFAPLHDETLFAQVAVDPVSGTISWPSGIDYDPDILHGDFEPANGRSLKLVREYRIHSGT